MESACSMFVKMLERDTIDIQMPSASCEAASAPRSAFRCCCSNETDFATDCESPKSNILAYT